MEALQKDGAGRAPFKRRRVVGAAVRESRCPRGDACRIEDVFRLLGKPYVLGILAVATHGRGATGARFVDFEERLGLSPTTLSERLKELVEAGLVERIVHDAHPPRVEYRVPDSLAWLEDAIARVHAWADEHGWPGSRPGAG